jgi:hypothetical protein
MALAASLLQEGWKKRPEDHFGKHFSTASTPDPKFQTRQHSSQVSKRAFPISAGKCIDRNQRATHSTIQFLAMQIPHKKVLVQRNNLQFAPPEVWHLPLADSETFRYSALQ